MTATLDWQACLSMSDNNEAIADELLSLFKAELPQFKADLVVSYQQKDILQLRELLHKLAGSCSYCGILALGEIIKQFQEQLRLEPQSDHHHFFLKLIEEVDRIQAVLDAGSYKT